MIIRKKMRNGGRSACAWHQEIYREINGKSCIIDGGISFGVTDYDPCLGYIDSNEKGVATLFVNRNACKEANVEIKFIEE